MRPSGEALGQEGAAAFGRRIAGRFSDVTTGAPIRMDRAEGDEIEMTNKGPPLQAKNLGRFGRRVSAE